MWAPADVALPVWLWAASSSVERSTEELPSHTHGATASTEGNHTHPLMEYAGISATMTNNHIQTSTNTNYTGPEAGYNGAHNHTINIFYTGGSQPHNNLPPHEVICRWKRMT